MAMAGVGVRARAAGTLERLECGPACAHACSDVFRGAELAPPWDRAGRAVERLGGGRRAAAGAARDHRRVAFLWVLQVLLVLVVVCGHLAARAADGQPRGRGCRCGRRVGRLGVVGLESGEWLASVEAHVGCGVRGWSLGDRQG